ncbi:MAG: hypothetical protein Q7O12_04060 [Deltaproteobacteria bacterium]|nr:hypothetical protein [Deltaproteobacteria bacterium]
MRVPQLKENPKGSQKWIQVLINACPELFNNRIRERVRNLSGRDICWVSPLKKDDFAEYRDRAFLERIGLDELSEELGKFWPKNGPQWDALGKTSDGETFFLVEAKANLPELVSFCGATNKNSLSTISDSLAKTQGWITCRNFSIDWKCGFYQYANRLAHLYFLGKMKKEAYLIFLYFVDDPTHISTSCEEWNAALELQKKLLGLSAKNLTGKVMDIFININEIRAFHGA